MSKTKLTNIGLFILGILIIILGTPMGIAICESYGNGEFTYVKGVMCILGVIILVLSFISGAVLLCMSVVAFLKDVKITQI
jgi:hypothetical protein